MKKKKKLTQNSSIVYGYECLVDMMWNINSIPLILLNILSTFKVIFYTIMISLIRND